MDDLFGSDVSDSETKGNPRSPVRGSSPAATETPGNVADDLFGSDTEDPVAPRPEKADGDALEDLFGSDEEAEQTGDRHTDRDDDDARSTHSMHSVDDDKYIRQKVKVLGAKIPVLPMPRASDDRFVIARTPNILQFESTPFSADAYEDVIADEHREAERSGFRTKVSAELASAVDGVISNTVRWRIGKNGKHESNTRLVRWSDGSMTVMVGGSVPESYNVSADSLAAEQQYIAAQHLSAGLMMSHAKLTDKWSLRPSRQSVKARHAVSHLLPRLKTAGSAAHKPGGTRFMVAEEDPELIAKREEMEEEKRERLRRKEEKLRERKEARDQRNAPVQDNAYSDDEHGYGYGSDEQDVDAERSARDSNRAGRAPAYNAAPFARRARNSYIDEEEDDDGFVVDDDAELEVGPHDEFDEEEEEEEEYARRLNDAKRTHGDDDDASTHHAGRSAKSRRLMDSDDDDDDF
ncbi:hypothetical protein EC988_004795 [Linderina pennispora]|nr:hypothetical protein EC988_004795 [Linderina pennispora]